MTEQPTPPALIEAQAARRKRRSRQHWQITEPRDPGVIAAMNADYHQRLIRTIGNKSYVSHW